MFRNFRDALGQISKSPGFALTAVLTLTFGIGTPDGIIEAGGSISPSSTIVYTRKVV
jgi:hypothetical protein